MTSSEDVLAFWVDEVGPDGWYKAEAAVDDQIRDRFAATWQAARADGRLGWSSHPRSTLALLIVLDQFPRNMFRGSGEAYASDGLARRVAKAAIDKRWDMRAPEPQRVFFYMPMMHSECLGDQDRAVRLIQERMPETGAHNLLHARAHREVIRRFGRFPHRNEEIGRSTSRAEADFLKAGGYGAVVRELTEPA